MNRSKEKMLRRMSMQKSSIGPSRALAPKGHRYITIGRYHRNQANAESYVLELFRTHYPQLPLDVARSRTFRAGEDANRFEVGFVAAVADARERGTAENLRSYVNGRDPYFAMSIAMSVDGEGPSIELGFAGQKLSLPAPMRQGFVEIELTEDILLHRRLASETSVKGHDGFQSTAMHFRGYLLASCALVEAFLNRCVLIDVYEGKSGPDLDELQRPCNVERRFELWLRHFAAQPLGAVIRGVEWDHYSELRRLRNSLMHSEHSMLGIGLKETARQLNLVRRGVGGLVNQLRALQRLPPVPFAERLATAPECLFVSEVPRATRQSEEARK